jgi:hypothetical protein
MFDKPTYALSHIACLEESIFIWVAAHLLPYSFDGDGLMACMHLLFLSVLALASITLLLARVPTHQSGTTIRTGFLGEKTRIKMLHVNCHWTRVTGLVLSIPVLLTIVKLPNDGFPLECLEQGQGPGSGRVSTPKESSSSSPTGFCYSTFDPNHMHTTCRLPY